MASFRQLDVDKLDPDSVVNNFPEVEASGISLSDAESLVSSARSALQSGNTFSALQTLLEAPPYGSDDATKDVATNGVVQVLASARSGDIASLVGKLSSAERNVLMKFLYRAMGTKQGQANGGLLLQWHERIVQASGEAPIIKHLTDRRTI